MNRLALGTVQFGLPYGIANRTGKVPDSEIGTILKLALAGKIDTLDTAISYGSSEESLGKAGMKGFKIVTKLPSLPDNCGDINNWVQLQLSESLSRLGVTKLYGVLLHQPEQLNGSKGLALYRAIELLKENGKVNKVGISIYSPNELAELTKKFNFDLVQAPFNLVDRRIYTSGWLKRLKDDNIEIHVRSAFLQGLLLMKQSDIPDRFYPWRGLIKKWHEWLSTQNITAVQACLTYLLSHYEIDRVVVGVDNVDQLAEILNDTDGQPITDFPNVQCEDEDLINPINWKRQ
jgi:aryl-alcohol dehydrogenase-like predicted oxidoreductase